MWKDDPFVSSNVVHDAKKAPKTTAQGEDEATKGEMGKSKEDVRHNDENSFTRVLPFPKENREAKPKENRGKTDEVRGGSGLGGIGPVEERANDLVTTSGVRIEGRRVAGARGNNENIRNNTKNALNTSR